MPVEDVASSDLKRHPVSPYLMEFCNKVVLTSTLLASSVDCQVGYQAFNLRRMVRSDERSCHVIDITSNMY